jgi:hypothetical protein
MIDGRLLTALGLVGLVGVKAATRGSRGVVRAARPAPREPACTYVVTYQEIDPDGDEKESGFVVDGTDIEGPDFVGPEVLRWRAEQGVDMPLEPSNDEDISDALKLWDDDNDDNFGLNLNRFTRSLRCAITFARIARDAGASEANVQGAEAQGKASWWSTDPTQDSRSGGYRSESYHPSDDLLVYSAVIGAIIQGSGHDQRASDFEKARAAVRKVLHGQ